MKILQNISLKSFTSMYVGGKARYFTEAKSVDDVLEALKFAKEKNLTYFILGGGSNVLVSDRGFNGLVIKICILGKKLIRETDKYIDYELGAGESWDNFVKFSVDNNLYGVENMSHIPGSVGASVVQNIGCYGEEVSETVLSVKLIHMDTLKQVVFGNKEIGFSYRRSRLNDANSDKGKYLVTHVVFRLQKQGELNMKYGDVQKYFATHPDITPNLHTLREAIISIRDNKFPFPDSPEHGTCGSFWNVDVVSELVYEKIIKKLQEKGFESKAEEMIKKKNVFIVTQGFKVVPGLFVEVLGFKGKHNGGAKILETHAGIINNFTGKATASEVFELSLSVIDNVYKEFGIKMKIEPELVGDFKIM